MGYYHTCPRCGANLDPGGNLRMRGRGYSK